MINGSNQVELVHAYNLHSKVIALYHVDMNGDETGEGDFGSSASVVSGSLAAGLFVFTSPLFLFWSYMV